MDELRDVPARPRKASLWDGLIFIAATAVCLALARASSLEDVRVWPLLDRTSRMVVGFRLVSLVALVWTFAYFPIRFRRPRPSLSVIARQPGMVACSAACSSMAFGFLNSLPSVAIAVAAGRTQSLAVIVETSANNLASASNLVIAHSVAGSWMALRMSGAWKAEAGWIDRMGRVLGLYWVLSLVFLNYQLLWQ